MAVSRRDFLKRSAIAGAAIALPRSLFATEAGRFTTRPKKPTKDVAPALHVPPPSSDSTELLVAVCPFPIGIRSTSRGCQLSCQQAHVERDAEALGRAHAAMNVGLKRRGVVGCVFHSITRHV